jgi:hypothetical protein
MIKNERPTILLNGKTPLQGADDVAANPIRFLFLALCAWKLRNGDMWPTISDLRAIRRQLIQKYPGVWFPEIKTDQNAEGSQVRVWARKLNREADLRKAQSEEGENKAVNGRATHSALQGKARPDKRRTGFITVSAPSAANADARIAFLRVNPLDIYVHEDSYQAIKL